MKLQGPDNNSGFTHEGISYEPDENGCIDLPPEVVGFAFSHGFKPVEATDSQNDAQVDFSKLNKKQLLSFARENLDIELDVALTNKEMIAAIEAALIAKASSAE